MSLKDCPSCGSPLGRAASKCRCGWKASEITQSPHVDCSHAPHCTQPAVTRIKVLTGWATFCWFHLDEYRHAKAETWCQEHGLITTAQKIAYCRKVARLPKPHPTEHWRRVFENPKMPLFARKMAEEILRKRGALQDREPGSDDELGRMILEQADPDFVDKKLQSCGS